MIIVCAAFAKHIFKTGCKLLRHSLFTLCESYYISTGLVPRIVEEKGTLILGKSAQLHGDPIKWVRYGVIALRFVSPILQLRVCTNIVCLLFLIFFWGI